MNSPIGSDILALSRPEIIVPDSMPGDTESNPTCSRASVVASQPVPLKAENLVMSGRLNTQFDPLSQMIRVACKDAVKAALNIGDISPRRLLSVEQTAIYLCLSEREIYNMLSTKQLAGVRHGKRLMVDIRDLEKWVEGHKAAL
jgi:excisionase family DNA binding protein